MSRPTGHRLAACGDAAGCPGCTGYVVAKRDPWSPGWELLSYGAWSTPESLRQLRRPGRRVRQFTDAEWDALPYGEQSGDWLWRDDRHVPRDTDGVRRG